VVRFTVLIDLCNVPASHVSRRSSIRPRMYFMAASSRGGSPSSSQRRRYRDVLPMRVVLSSVVDDGSVESQRASEFARGDTERSKSIVGGR